MRTHLIVCLSCIALLSAPPALAQGEDEATEVTEATETGMTERYGAYPGAEIDRPLVLPPMMLEARGGLTFAHTSVDLGPLGSESSNIVGLFAGAGFGVVDGLEAGIGGGFFPSGPGLGLQLLLSPDFDVGDLPLYAMYDLTGLLGVSGLEVAGRLTMNLPLATEFGLLADAPFKLKLNETIAVIGNAGLGVQLGDAGLLLALNGGGLIQATDQIAVSATLGMLAFVGDDSTVLVPLAVRGEYNLIEFLDVFAELSFVDLNNWGADWILVQAGASYRLGL